MNFRTAVLTIALGFALTGAATAQVISYSPRTGDISIDTQLGAMNGYGRDNRDYFVDDVVGNFGAPRYLVNDLLTTRRWAPGDVYYACALAYQLRRPCADVVRMYEQDRGQGWGVIAKRMGIKPGSAQFHALKGQLGKSNGKFKSHKSNAHSSHVDGPGNSGKHDQGHDKGHDQGHDKGKSNDKGKGKGNDKGKGKGGKH